jgi:hypothetical protein
MNRTRCRELPRAPVARLDADGRSHRRGRRLAAPEAAAAAVHPADHGAADAGFLLLSPAANPFVATFADKLSTIKEMTEA